MKLPWLKPSEALNRPLNRQSDSIASSVSLAQPEKVRRLGFHIGNLGLLIAPRATSELTDMLPTCPLPNAAPWLIGLINLRGNLVPVFDLNMLLNLERTPDKKKLMLLILGQGHSAGAILIDELPIHITLSEEEDKLASLPPLPSALKPFVSSGFEKNGELWFNFDHLGFFQSLASKVAF